MAGSFGLAALGIEPVATFFFLFAWAGLIFTFDRLIAKLEGRSLIARLGAAPFARIVMWSAVNWFVYELANLRLHNWHYVFVSDHDLARCLGTVLAFGTVLPGLFWIDHWLKAQGVLSSVRRRPVIISAGLLTGMQITGILSLALCLADPGRFYPLIWGVTALLLAPLNHRRGIDGWLRQWQRGEFGPALRMLLAGGMAGGFWEFFNFWARGKWIYTVPLFDEWKLFEMPLLGFVGFPAFALECACVYRLLVWYRLAPAFGAFTQQGPVRGPLTRVVAVVVATLIATTGYAAVDRVIVTSRTPRVDDVAPLTTTQREALSEAGITHLTQLAGWGSAERWQAVIGALATHEAEPLMQIVDLYLHQGIGTTYGNRLVTAGITSLEGLRDRDVDDVWQTLKQVDAPGPIPTRAQVKVWLLRLPEPEIIGAPATYP
jgi:predicted flap endonuclease-1-like 5' DNA nuclease